MRRALEAFILLAAIGLWFAPLQVRAQFDEEGGAAAETAPAPSAPALEVTSEDMKRLSAAREQKSESAMLDAVSRILGKDSKNLPALNALAVFYFEADKPGLSKIILNRALADHPNVPALYNNLGIVYLKEEDQRQAIASFRKSLQLKSDYAQGSANLASIYLEYKDYSRALSPLEDAYRATKSGLDKGEVLAVEFANNYAVALAGVGEAEKAEDVYENIVKGNSKNTTVLLNYAILLVERLNKPKPAMAIISKIKFVSDDREVLRRVEELEKKASVKE
jgi:Tfp pilus assembly protein PilF